MSKYQPIGDMLVQQGGGEVRLPFKAIEDALGFPLPASARTHPAWWSNHEGGHVQARSWLRAGYYTLEVDLKQERVRFRRRPEGSGAGNEQLLHAPGPGAERVCVSADQLSKPARQLYEDYLAEMGGDRSAVVARAFHEAAMARRRRAVEDLAAKALKAPVGARSAVDLIREDRER